MCFSLIDHLSQFVNLAAGRYIFEEGSGLEATTTRAQSVQIALDDRELEVFDTPGPDADEGGAGKACLFQLLHKLSVTDVLVVSMGLPTSIQGATRHCRHYIYARHQPEPS